MSLEKIKGIVSDQYYAGTRVINCLVHNGPLDERPCTCINCLADLKNQFNLALDINKWLNEKLDAVRDVVGVKHD